MVYVHPLVGLKDIWEGLSTLTKYAQFKNAAIEFILELGPLFEGTSQGVEVQEEAPTTPDLGMSQWNVVKAC